MSRDVFVILIHLWCAVFGSRERNTEERKTLISMNEFGLKLVRVLNNIKDSN
jgi:hypothetical protein